MEISIHAGHNPDGKIACGAVGFLKESTENRNVVKYIKKYLTSCGITVYDDTNNNATSVTDNLNKIVKNILSHKTDLILSIHFNSGACDKFGNGVTTGAEIWVKHINEYVEDLGHSILNNIAKLGFKNRGIKQSDNLYVLNSTYDTPTMLIECCFVDDLDDAKKYNAKKMAAAISEAIINNMLCGKTLNFVTTKKGVKKRSLPTLNNKYVCSSLDKKTKISVNNVCVVDNEVFGYNKKLECWYCLKNVKVVK